MSARNDGPSIWWWAFGYFAAYVPYSAMTKALSSGQLGARIDGLVVLPLAVFASTVAMGIFLLATGWWHAASSTTIAGFAWPVPSKQTAISGACTAAILVTTTLAYTFEGVSIVFAMLLMRGGVLLIAPIVDALSGRAVQPRSWLALILTLLSLVVVFVAKHGFSMPVAAAVDIAVYLLAYFARLRLMTGVAKSETGDDNRRYFVEEQLVASPLSLLLIGLWALLGASHTTGAALRQGFVEPWSTGSWWILLVVGVLSQLTGVFGGLILLDRRENSFCVPVNRASSVLAGVLGTAGLWLLHMAHAPATPELIGAALLVAAIVVLSWPASKRGA